MSRIIDQIYKTVSELFPTTEKQLFAMEFPGRVLDETSFSYEVDSHNALLTKPEAVLEQEFRLSDDLYDVSQILGGPNGKKLSRTFELMLNTLVPKYGDLPHLDEDRTAMRKWLMEKESIEVDGTVHDVSRMDAYHLLSQRYLDAKTAWGEEKNAMLVAARDSDPAEREEKTDEYAKFLATVAPAKEAMLESLFNDLVVRGYYHKVRSLLGYLDVPSPAEALEDSRQRMRSSSLSSLDESETVYPVQFQPADWFKGLSTDFKSEDLLLQPEALQMKLTQKESELDDLRAQRQALQVAHTGDEGQLQAEVDAAQGQLDEAQSHMIDNFSSATISIVQMYLDKKYKNRQKKEKSALDILDGDKTVDEGLNNELKAANEPPITDEQFTQIKKFQENAINAQRKLTQASRKLSVLQERKAQAESTNTKQALLDLDARISKLSTETRSLKKMLFSNFDPKAKVAVAPDAATIEATPVLPTTMPPAGKFMDVVISHTQTSSQGDTSLVSSAEHTQFEVDVFIGSAAGSSDTARSSFNDSHSLQSSQIDVGFRAMKVTIDRGGWFNPQFFDLAKDMTSLTGGADGPNISNFDPKKYNLTALDHDAVEELNDAVFPAFPVAFVVVKDVTIRFKSDSDFSDEHKSLLQKSSEVGGGFLCFSASHSESSTDQSESFHHAVDGKSMLIKIPGPQILGWFLEMVPQVKAGPYQPMNGHYLPATAGVVETSAAVALTGSNGNGTTESAVNGSATPVAAGHG